MVNEDPATIPRNPENTIKTQSNMVNEDPAAVLRDPNTIKHSQWGPCVGPQRPKQVQQTEPATRSMRAQSRTRSNEETHKSAPNVIPQIPRNRSANEPKREVTKRPPNQPQTRRNKETHQSATVDYRPNDVEA